MLTIPAPDTPLMPLQGSDERTQIDSTSVDLGTRQAGGNGPTSGHA